MTITTEHPAAHRGTTTSARPAGGYRDPFPRHPIPAAETAMVEVAAAHSNGLTPIVGERTDVAGLVLTPHATGQVLHYSGLWCLTHIRSGARVSPPASLLHTREALLWLDKAGVDWDRPAADLHADPAARSTFHDLFFALTGARETGRPLVYARTSWVDWPPLWRICHRGIVSPEGYDTFEDAAALVHGALTSPGGVLHPDAVILRDTHSPGWALRCSSIACTDRDSFHPDDWDYGFPAVDTRAALQRTAWDEGWRGHDHTHWTCPDCTGHYH